LERWERHKDHQEDETGNCEHEHDFDDRKAFIIFSLLAWHGFLSLIALMRRTTIIVRSIFSFIILKETKKNKSFLDIFNFCAYFSASCFNVAQ